MDEDLEHPDPLIAEHRKVMRAMMLRSERTHREHLQRVDALIAGLTHSRFETRAETQAVLRLLDRFGSGEAPAGD